MEKKYKINVPKGNPDDGFTSREVKARIIHHPLEDKITLMGYNDKHKSGKFVIVELTTGRVVAMGNDLFWALVSLNLNYKTFKQFQEATKKWVDKYGEFNPPLKEFIVTDEITPVNEKFWKKITDKEDPLMPSPEARAGINPPWAEMDHDVKSIADDLLEFLAKKFAEEQKATDDH